MSKWVLFLLLPFLVLGGVLMMGFVGVVLAIAPPFVSLLALAVLAVIALFSVIKIRAGKNAAGSLDGEAALLPSARAKGGLL